MSGAPRLYARFKTDAGHYVYDAATNHILTVSSEAWRSLDCYLDARTTRDHGTSGAGGALDLSAAAAQQIESGLASGFLAPCPVTRMHFYQDEAELLRRVSCRIPHLILELTERCNLRCHYCPYTYDSTRVKRGGAMSADTMRNAVRTFMAHNSEASSPSISFWGGEPLLQFAVMKDTVSHIAREYPAISLFYTFATNGTLIDADIARFLVDHDIHLVVSVDGPRDVHDRHRVDAQGRGTFDAVVRGLDQIRHVDAEYYRRRVAFLCVIAPGTDLDTLADHFTNDERFAGHEVSLNTVSQTREFVARYGRFTESERRRTEAKTLDALRDLSGEPRGLSAKAGAKRLFPIAARRRGPIGPFVPPNGCCAPLLKKMHVRVDGAIHVCEKMDTDNPVGNVNGGGVDLQTVKELVDEYCRHSLDDCARCWAVRLCRMCYRDFVKSNRWDGRWRDARCAFSRAELLTALEDYVKVLERNPHAFDYLKGVTVDQPV